MLLNYVILVINNKKIAKQKGVCYNMIGNRSNSSKMSKNEKRDVKMAVIARPQKTTFVVSSKKAKEFRDGKMSKENWEDIKKMSQQFDKNNLKK